MVSFVNSVDWAGAIGRMWLVFRAVFPFYTMLRTLALGAACLVMAASCRPMATGPGEPSSRLCDLKGAFTPGNREAALADRIQTKTVERVTDSTCLLPDEEAR